MKKAYFSSKFKQLEYWNSRNTTVCVNCSNIKTAETIVKNSGIEQHIERN